MKTKITIVGCGPGALDHLTPAARQAIAGAEVLVGAPRLLQAFAPASAERIVVGADIGKVLREIAARIGRKKIAVLVSGDPGLASVATPVIKRFGRASCHVIPGVSSAQAAFARVGVDWLDARIISAHDHAPSVRPAALARSEKIAVLAGNEKTNAWVVSLASRLARTHRIFVCENLTLPDERVRRVKAAELQTMTLPSRTIVLLIKRKALL
ncbi:MAG: precorrin-6y C5,15-methyltransferase (decarboxylating) subunit CbiE [Verrucomicrobia bacterium]|nr:precorrin-6y C5,15-methyltransferase (decarboxylating) subunit CbiE [Verrucomicrobiota bacterium]